jgi:DNA-binding transcriptional MocR family regulator
LKFRIVPVSVGLDGVDVNALERAVEAEFEKVSAKKMELNKNRFWAMFYTIPTFQNPTGTLLSPEKSRRIVEIARKFDLVRK